MNVMCVCAAMTDSDYDAARDNFTKAEAKVAAATARVKSTTARLEAIKKLQRLFQNFIVGMAIATVITVAIKYWCNGECARATEVALGVIIGLPIGTAAIVWMDRQSQNTKSNIVMIATAISTTLVLVRSTTAAVVARRDEF